MTAPLSDFLIQETWDQFTQQEHDLWRFLYERQLTIFPRCVAKENQEGLEKLNICKDRIPKFSEVNERLLATTGWQIVAVNGLVPDDAFFQLLAEKKFPSTCFLRSPDKIDYLQEPDIFHDMFGHVPLLVHPTFANYMEAFAHIALKCLERGELKRAARIYWFTIEFGLIRTREGLRTYGSGIVSSYKETIYCVEDAKPLRIPFNLERVMRTNYRIDDIQENYFVIDSYEDLFNATLQDQTALINRVSTMEDIQPGTLLEGEINLPQNKRS